MPGKPDEVTVLFPGQAVPVADRVLSILEDRFPCDAMNLLEHASCAGSTVLLTSRVGFAFLPGGGSRP